MFSIDDLDLIELHKLYLRSHIDNISIKDFQQKMRKSFDKNTATFIKPIFISNENAGAFCILYFNERPQPGRRYAYFSNLMFDANFNAVNLLRNKIQQETGKLNVEHTIGPLHESLLIERGVGLSSSAVSWGMPSNCTYYDGILQAAGFHKEKDLLEIIWKRGNPKEKFLSYRRLLGSKFKDFDFIMKTGDEIKAISRNIAEFYNIEWRNNWSFYPMQINDISDFCASMPASRHHGVFSYRNRKLVGFVAFAQSKNDLEKHTESARAYFIGVSEKLRKTGLAAYLFSMAGDYIIHETSIGKLSLAWMLDENKSVLRLVRGSFSNSTFSENIYRIYRI